MLYFWVIYPFKTLKLEIFVIEVFHVLLQYQFGWGRKITTKTFILGLLLLLSVALLQRPPLSLKHLPHATGDSCVLPQCGLLEKCYLLLHIDKCYIWFLHFRGIVYVWSKCAAGANLLKLFWRDRSCKGIFFLHVSSSCESTKQIFEKKLTCTGHTEIASPCELILCVSSMLILSCTGIDCCKCRKNTSEVLYQSGIHWCDISIQFLFCTLWRI